MFTAHRRAATRHCAGASNIGEWARSTAQCTPQPAAERVGNTGMIILIGKFCGILDDFLFHFDYFHLDRLVAGLHHKLRF